MIFSRTRLADVIKIDIEPIIDRRGFFARAYCADTFEQKGLPSRYEQCSISRNWRAGTIRGMHYQAAPHAEAKLVRCVRGAIFDVLIDLRAGTADYLRWIGETLTASNAIALYVPPGVAHGFQTLEDDTDVLYQITPAYRAGFAQGIRWNDPTFGIKWPLEPTEMSDRDAGYPDFFP